MNLTPTDLVEEQVITTRFYQDPECTFVSMAGVVYKTSETGRRGCILNPNDRNSSLVVSNYEDDGLRMTVCHCFAGLFASRVYRCLDKPWEIFRLHLNMWDEAKAPEPDLSYGQLVTTDRSSGKIAHVYLEHFGPQILRPEFIIELFSRDALDDFIEESPVKLTPDPRLYQIGMQMHPHPQVVPVHDAVLRGYEELLKQPKRIYTA